MMNILPINTSHIELLSPAGSEEALSAAIKAGADAVYFGVEQLNMRARAAKLITVEQLPDIAARCFKNNVKTYLALNTVIYDHEIELVRKICKSAKESGISAIIASDWSVIQTANEMKIPVHISTQANISNIEAVRFFAQAADVMVLARELSLEQIQTINSQIRTQNISGPEGKPIRTEAFIHGALCVAISGKCYMSLAAYNHSANRGDCFQVCRRSYRVIDEETGKELAIENKYVMSPRDLCTIGMLDKLVNSGISIFKIEGRGRPADYVYKATKVYREALEAIAEGTYTPQKVEQWTIILQQIFNRKFWMGGYYLGKKMEEWAASSNTQASLEKIFSATITNYFKKINVAEFRVQSEQICIGDRIMVTGPTTGFSETTVKSIHSDRGPVEKAVKGQKAAIPFPETVRKNDKLYILRTRKD